MNRERPGVFALPATARGALLPVHAEGIALDESPGRFALALAPRHQPRRVLYLGITEADALALLACLEDALTRPTSPGGA